MQAHVPATSTAAIVHSTRHQARPDMVTLMMPPPGLRLPGTAIHFLFPLCTPRLFKTLLDCDFGRSTEFCMHGEKLFLVRDPC